MPIVRTATMFLACIGLGGCAGGYQLEVRFEDRGIAEAAARIDLWIVPACAAVTDDRSPPSDAIAHVVARSGGATDGPGELPREGELGVLARARDDQCRIVAESCETHRFERGGQGTISITLHAIEPPRGCAGGEACRDGSCTAAVDAGIDASRADAGPEDAAVDATSLDGGPPDGGPPGDACVPGSAMAYQGVIERDLPVAWYRLSDPAGTTVAVNEIVGSPDGHYSNNPMVSGSEGAIPGDTGDRALHCYPRLPDGSQMGVSELGDVLLSGELTVEMWLRRALGADRGILQRFIFAEFYAMHGWRFYMPTSSLIALTSNESGNTAGEYNEVLLDGRTIPFDARWHHLVLTMGSHEDRAPYRRSTVAIYLDGTAMTSGELFDFVPAASVEMAICSGAGNFFFDGDVDELAIYDRPLSPAEVASHWNAGRVCN